MSFQFRELESDIMDNPGEIDNRLLENKTNSYSIVYLGSMAEYLKEEVGNPTENR